MPIVNVYICKGKTGLEKKSLMDSIASKISKATGTDKGNIYIFLNEVEPDNVTIQAPVMAVSWAANSARGNEAKKLIMAELSKVLSEFSGAELGKVVVTFTDLPLTNVSVGGIARG